MANSTKNTGSTTNLSKNTPVNYDTPYKRSPSKGLTWDKATQTWEKTPETWEEVEQANWSNQTKNTE